MLQRNCLITSRPRIAAAKTRQEEGAFNNKESSKANNKGRICIMDKEEKSVCNPDDGTHPQCHGGSCDWCTRCAWRLHAVSVRSCKTRALPNVYSHWQPTPSSAAVYSIRHAVMPSVNCVLTTLSHQPEPHCSPKSHLHHRVSRC